MIRSNSSRPAFEGGAFRKGSALVIVLALVVLLTFLIVAFLTRSQTDLVASSNYSKSMQAEEIAQLGSSFLISGLQQEVRQAMKTTGVKATVWPARSVVADPASGGDPANPTVDERNPREFTAFRISGASSPDYDAAYGPGVASTLPPNVASNVRTDTGRRPLDPARWNAPRLLPYTPRSGSNWVNCPSWIYVTRSGPKSLTAPFPYSATLAQMKNVSDASNLDAAIGRFAYVMYDVSGLLDINVAGAPLSGTDLAKPLFGEKGSSAFANLATLFSSTAIPNAGNAADFVTWKIPASVDFHKTVAGEQLADVGLIEKGMLESLPGSNTFFSRQDLIKFSGDNSDIVRGGRSYRSAGGVDADSGILKFLRTSSRSVNAPMLDEAIPFPSGGPNDLVTTTAVTIPRYKVSGVDKAEQDDYQIAADEPLFQRKFPLSRIRWFSNHDVTGQPRAEVREAIKQHFGLTPVSDLSERTTSKEWAGVPGFVYTSPDGTVPATKIKTLAEVAALPEKREPDFFEWLKGAIDSDTLGVDAGWTMSDIALPQDQSKDFQIIQIGANILDQVDADDLPTLILTSVDNVKDRNDQPLVALGVENVPYINEMIVSVKREGQWNQVGAENMSAWLQPEIWMPHYSANAVSTRAGYNDPNEIGSFRMRVVDGEGWLHSHAAYTAPSTEFKQVRSASERHRKIEPRVFEGSDATDSLTFSLADEDFRDPKIPGQSTALNPYNNGPVNGSPDKLREVLAGPEPGQVGFKGIFAGRATDCGIVPGATLKTSYQDRTYYFYGNLALDSESHDCLRDPLGEGAEDLDGDGLPDPGTSMESFPMGQRYYNAFTYLTLATPGNKPSNSPSGNPRPLTIVLEAKLAGDKWVPVQILERVVFGRGSEAPAINPSNDATSARSDQNWGWDNSVSSSTSNASRYKDYSNICPTGEVVPGYPYTYMAITSQVKDAKDRPGLSYYRQKAAGGVPGGLAKVPEELAWCRPILSGEDPDPSNSIYPLAKTPSVFPRNDADKRNPNEYLATNDALSGKTGAGGGNEQRFSSLFFGWSTIRNRISVIKVDPRTRRFGQGGTIIGASGGSSIRPTDNKVNMVDLEDMNTLNWDVLTVGGPGKEWNPSTETPLPGGQRGALYPNWHSIYFRQAGATQPKMVIADLMRNLQTDLNGNPLACYYEAKGSGKIRPADYAFVPDNELPTLPMQTYSAALKSRPVVLNRMFRSTAELGLVFRDVPWKTLDFFSGLDTNGNPVSGDTRLSDVFCVEDSPLSAGRVDPNKAPRPVLEALLSGALEFPGRDINTVTNAVTDQGQVRDIIEQFTGSNVVSYNASEPLNSLSLARDSDIATALMACDAVTPTGGGNRKQKSAVEAMIRGLSGSMDTRTWNIFIDVVAEAGRLPLNASNLEDFVPSAQRRYWIFVALDRITGRILDYHYEIVAE